MKARKPPASAKRLTASNLEALGAEALAALLLELSDSQPALKRRLRMELSGEISAAALAEEIDKRLAMIAGSLFSALGFVCLLQADSFVDFLVYEVVLGIGASMIVMWFSRHREFRADAAGAQLAGRDSMIGALERLKIATKMPETMPEKVVEVLAAPTVRISVLRVSRPMPPELPLMKEGPSAARLPVASMARKSNSAVMDS